MSRDSIVIVGTGLMGSGIAAVSALAGERTILVGRKMMTSQAGLMKALSNITELKDNGLAEPDAADKAQLLLSVCNNLDEALPQASIVIEAILENLEVKQSMFQRLDGALPPDIPILSNTSGLRISEIAKNTKYPQRTMTTHFWFPGHLVPLVEVVMGEYTDEAMAVAVKDRLKRWGKAPVLVKRDLPGQLANRILQAIIREAVSIIESGLATAEDVDTAVKMGMGIRLPAWGILEHVDGVGLDLCRSVQNTVLPDISTAQEANPLFTKMIDNGNLGYKSGKGFYDWSVKSMEKLALKRNHFIIQALKILKESDQGDTK